MHDAGSRAPQPPFVVQAGSSKDETTTIDPPSRRDLPRRWSERSRGRHGARRRRLRAFAVHRHRSPLESELQNTTASVSVLDATRYLAGGAQHFEDVINTLSNVTWTGGTSRPRFIQIRGIGENSQFEGETPDASVRFLVDDFDFTGIGAIGGLFDTQQVELLRGPQAGAFGANAAGGVVKLVAADPTPYWSGKAEGTVGTDNLVAGGVALGGPLSGEALTFRLSVYQLFQDGYRENRFLEKSDTNQRDELSTRLKLRWAPSAEFQLDGSIFYADLQNGYDEFVLNNDREDTYSDVPGRDAQESAGASLRATIRGIDGAEIRAITQFTTTDSLYRYDSDWGAGSAPAPFTSGYNGVMDILRDRDVFSQELRADSTAQEDALGLIDRWTVGIYWHQLEEATQFAYTDDWGIGAGRSDYETETRSLFGQLSHDFSDSTRLIVGLRYEHHEVDFVSDVTDDYYGSLDRSALPSHKEDDLWGGKVTLEQDFAEGQIAFLSVTRGYKSGGANNGGFILPGDPLTYGAEILYNYELGLRSQWADGRIVSQITLFHLDRNDAQLRDSAGAGGFFHYFTSNQGDAQHEGMEAEVTVFVNEQLTLGASLGLLDTELKGTGRDLSNAPAYNFSMSADYRMQNGLSLGLEIAGRDRHYESNSHDQQRDAYAIVNASLGYQFKRWDFSLWSRNLFDENYAERVFYFDNYDPTNPGEHRYEAPAAPLQVGATVRYVW